MLFYMLFLLASFSGISSGGKLSVHRGKSLMLFSSIGVDNFNIEDIVSLYINGDNNHVLIAVWRFGNGSFPIRWLDDYYARKIFMDRYRNIWIFDVVENDAGVYVIKYGELNNSTGPKVELTVLDELTEEEQIQIWLDDHPEFKMKYLGKLKEKQILGLLDNLHQEHYKKFWDYSCSAQIHIIAILVIIVVLRYQSKKNEMVMVEQEVGGIKHDSVHHYRKTDESKHTEISLKTEKETLKGITNIVEKGLIRGRMEAHEKDIEDICVTSRALSNAKNILLQDKHSCYRINPEKKRSV